MADNEGEASIDGDAEAPHPPKEEEQPNAEINQPQEGGEKPLEQGSDEQEWDADLHFDWDSATKEALRESNRVALDKAIGTYIKDWRIFQEILQNAIDSYVDPDTGEAIDFGADHKPKITIELNAVEDFIMVADNGIGIAYDNRHFLSRAYAGKKDQSRDDSPEKRRALKGSQGIGLKASVFSSKHFKIHTKKFQSEEEGWTWTENDLVQVPLTGQPHGHEINRPVNNTLRDTHGTTIWMSEGYDDSEERYDTTKDGWQVIDFLNEKLQSWIEYFNLKMVDYQHGQDYVDHLLESERLQKAIRRTQTRINNLEKKIEEIVEKGDDKTNVERNQLRKHQTELSKQQNKLTTNEKLAEEVKDVLDKHQGKKYLNEITRQIRESGSKEEKSLISDYADKKKADEKSDETLAARDVLFKKIFELHTEETHHVLQPSDQYGNKGFKVSLGKVFEHYLLTRTYAADLTRHLGLELPDVEIEYKIVLAEEHLSHLRYCKPDLVYEGTVKVGYRTLDIARKDVVELGRGNPILDEVATWAQSDTSFISETDKIVLAGRKDTLQFRNRVYSGFWKSKEEIEDAMKLMEKDSEEDNPIRREFEESDKNQSRAGRKFINGIYCIIGSSEFLKNRLGIAPVQEYSVNGLPINIDINLEGAGNRGAQTQVHLIVDIDTPLGIGKRNMGVHGNQLNSLSKALVLFWNRTVVPIARAVSGLDGNDETTLVDFDTKAQDLVDDDEEFTVMIEEFGRLTMPSSEQDVIQMHNYNMGLHDTRPNWLTLSTRTNIDAISLPEFQTKETKPQRIEYKGPGNSNDLLEKELNGLSKQTFNSYELAVVWDYPTEDELGRGGFTFTNYLDEQTGEKQKYPAFAGYDNVHMARVTKGSSTAYFYSIKSLFDYYVKAYKEKAAEEKQVEVLEEVQSEIGEDDLF